jgi:cytochrome c2
MPRSPFEPAFLACFLVLSCAGQLDDPDRFAELEEAGGQPAAGQAGAGGGGGSSGQAGSAGAAGSQEEPPLDLTKADLARGKIQADLCTSCHGADLSGSSIGVWAPNLTPDEATGLGSWTPEQIRAALRQGVRPDGSSLCSSMPRFGVEKTPSSALLDLIAYLRALPPTASPPQGQECP